MKIILLLFAFFLSLCFADSSIQAIRLKKIHLGDGTTIEDGVLLIQDGKILEVGNTISIPPGSKILAEGTQFEATPGFINFSTAIFTYSTERKDVGQSVNGAGEGFDPYHQRWKNYFEPSRKQIQERLQDGTRHYFSESFREEMFKSGVTTYVLSSGTSRWIEGLSSVVRLKKAGVSFEVLREEHALLMKFSDNIELASKQIQLFESFLQRNKTYQENKAQAQQDLQNYRKELLTWQAEKQKAEKAKQKFTKESPKHPLPFKEDKAHEIVTLLRNKKKTLYLDSKQVVSIRALEKLANDYALSVCWKQAPLTAYQTIQPKKNPVIILPEQLKDYQRTAVAFSRNKIPVVFGTGSSPEASRFLRLLVCQWIRQGMSRQAAIQGLTSSAAKLLGLENKIGMLKKGLGADIVVFNGDPLNSLSSVVLVVIQGEVVYEAP